MTVDEIFRLLDNPATIGEALIEAAKLPFRGEYKILFQQKRQKYIAGLSDYERPIWVGEMKNLLSLCESLFDGESPREVKRASTSDGVYRSWEFKNDIFISYAQEDRQRVEPIVQELEKLGWCIFWDRNLRAGHNWPIEISRALDESRCVLVFWSFASVDLNKHHWVREEAETGRKRGVLVPLCIDDVEPPLGFRTIQAETLVDWKQNTSHPKFLQLIEAIASQVPLPGDLQRRESAVRSPVPPPIQPKVFSDFVLIRGGIFPMGSTTGEVDRFDDETQHQVKVSDFYLCRYTVTVAEFREFIEASRYRTDAEKGDGSYVWNGNEWNKRAGINWRYGISGSERNDAEENHPVLHVSWNDAVAYCKWLSATTGEAFRLPTEAEWEYACRAGTTTPFNTGENLLTGQANYDGNYPYKSNQKGVYRENTVSVDSFTPNPWGLFNMHGNIWEWCGDWYAEKYYEECKTKGTVENPSGPVTGSNRVLRGGYWGSYARDCRSAYRNYFTPGHRSTYVGFRLVFVP